jgi:hypothetical protein
LKLSKILFGVSTARSLFPPPHVDEADFTILDQRAKLILGDVQPAGGLLAVH